MTVSVTVRANGVPACVSEWVIPKRIFFSDPNSNPTHFFTLCLRFITKISVWKMGRWSVGRFVFDLLLRLCAPVECWPKTGPRTFIAFYIATFASQRNTSVEQLPLLMFQSPFADSEQQQPSSLWLSDLVEAFLSEDLFEFLWEE